MLWTFPNQVHLYHFLYKCPTLGLDIIGSVPYFPYYSNKTTVCLMNLLSKGIGSFLLLENGRRERPNSSTLLSYHCPQALDLSLGPTISTSQHFPLILYGKDHPIGV